MDENYSKQHEEEILKAFEKMTDDFREGLSSDIESPAEDIKPAEEGTEAMAETNKPAGRRSRSKAGAAAAAKTSKTSAKSTAASKSLETAKPKKAKKGKFKILKIAILVIFLLGVVACIVAGFMALSVIKDAPEINPDNLYDLLAENSVILDSEGNLLENVYSGDSLRSNVEYNNMPQNLIDAFVCTEDKTFWDHHGFNFIRMGGAVWDSLKSGGEKRIGGTSTITQQLARNLYLPEVKSQRSLSRKIIEAYYAVILENSLTKEQIIEAYLNTIYLGFNSNGVQAASTAYFSKDVEDLSLVECACLATLPQQPNSFSPIKRIATSEVTDFEALDIVSQTDEWVIYYNDAGSKRLNLVLYNMHAQGKITDEEYEAAKADNLRDHIDPNDSIASADISSYFADYVVSQVKADLVKAGYDQDSAEKLVYSGGLIINSTLDMKIQQILETEYSKPANFPSVGSYKKDKDGNILSDAGKILLYNEEKAFDAEGNYIINADEFRKNNDGSITLLGGKRLNFYKTTVGGNTDYSIEFKDMYIFQEKILCSQTGAWNIAAQYKNKDGNGDLTISADFFSDKPGVITEDGNGNLVLSSKYYTMRKPVQQPQSAMVIIDYRDGHLLGMIGGRSIEGKLLYNRATAPRQPGSSIKPISVYATALQAGQDGLGNFHAAMPLDDRPVSLSGKAWPKNWYSGYRGMQNLRYAVEQSINCCAVNLFNQLTAEMCVEKLQANGITTLVTSGEVNDMNASALALGGMAKGISPLEMAAAYATLGNYGTYTEPMCYTTVTTKKGDIVLEKTPIKHEVFSQEVASLMTDILRTTVTNGLGSGAKLKSQPTAGKTGTTSDRYDVWFCGLTPQLAAATWIGNDVNISMNQGSGAATKLWSAVMEQVGALYEKGSFEMKGEFVTATVDKKSGKAIGPLTGGDVISEIFIEGTVPGEADDCHQAVTICTESGYLATPACMSTATKVGILRPGGKSWEKILNESNIGGVNVASLPDSGRDVPEYYCPIHQVPGYQISKYTGNYLTEDVEVTQPETDPEQPDPGIEQPGAEGPGTTDPGTEQPGTNEPGVHGPGFPVGPGNNGENTKPETPAPGPGDNGGISD